MELTSKQQEGLNLAVGRYKLGEPYTCISGYALQDKICKCIYHFC